IEGASEKRVCETELPADRRSVEREIFRELDLGEEARLAIFDRACRERLHVRIEADLAVHDGAVGDPELVLRALLTAALATRCDASRRETRERVEDPCA